MIKTTRKQRLALKRLVERNNVPSRLAHEWITYKQLRENAVPYLDKSGCIMVQLWGMWLGIETDGYTHS